ncbi:glycoside hydrolase family 97 protein [Xylanibacter oryzae]|uniref:glycoside hydrolase family 97 protein n=1 Tax=Xylanibacter oryzae TaxID=185293 RepID=UPI0004ADDA2E|nr:glycoside hydrolase family 97 protein [Xylanibacter oryzae]
MKRQILLSLALMTAGLAMAGDVLIKSPDSKLVVIVSNEDGRAEYSVNYEGKQMLTKSYLGLKTNIEDFTQGLTLKNDVATSEVNNSYTMNRTKRAVSEYHANQALITFENSNKREFTVTFQVSNNNIAYKYSMPRYGDTKCMIIEAEASSFNFPAQTTTFLCPQIGPMTGWERTKPSYEEEYTADSKMNVKSQFSHGYTFPCLFHIGNNGWALVSETGVTGKYCGSHLSDYDVEKGYTIAFPDKGENNGVGINGAAISLPGETPWRTITLGNDLKPIVETTLPYDITAPQYSPSQDYKPGRYTWSWLLWQDKSVNYNDQVKFIDLASEMGYEYVLVDNWWDVQIGRDRMKQLSDYAKSKGVNLMVWYNSNGYVNDAPQSPRDCMNTSIARKKEMAWLKDIGVKGIKVDFFGGDKQETMKLYEDILSDANDYGLQVIFHGCTIPRGWERMYPNYVGSEAVLASENLYFTQHHCDKEGFELTMHPFSRNAVASMDWGGVIMNRRMSQDNNSRNYRRTSDTFEMAAGIINQCSINCIAIQPNNLKELPQFEIDFLKNIPTTWDDTKYITGYPTKYVVIARKHGNDWYVAGLNGTDKEMALNIEVPMLAGKTVKYYTDNKKKGKEIPTSVVKTMKIGKNGIAKVFIQAMGAIILVP